MVKSILRTLLRLCSENCSLLNSVGMIKLIFAFHAKFNINLLEKMDQLRSIETHFQTDHFYVNGRK